MIKKIAKWIRDFIFNYYDNCYTDMEYEGHASMGCCGGVVGGTSATNYLSETCVSCPYLVLGCEKKNLKGAEENEIN